MRSETSQALVGPKVYGGWLQRCVRCFTVYSQALNVYLYLNMFHNHCFCWVYYHFFGECWDCYRRKFSICDELSSETLMLPKRIGIRVPFFATQLIAIWSFQVVLHLFMVSPSQFSHFLRFLWPSNSLSKFTYPNPQRYLHWRCWTSFQKEFFALTVLGVMLALSIFFGTLAKPIWLWHCLWWWPWSFEETSTCSLHVCSAWLGMKTWENATWRYPSKYVKIKARCWFCYIFTMPSF